MLTSQVMDSQIHAIEKAIRPLFADPVTNYSQFYNIIQHLYTKLSQFIDGMVTPWLTCVHSRESPGLALHMYFNLLPVFLLLCGVLVCWCENIYLIQIAVQMKYLNIDFISVYYLR